MVLAAIAFNARPLYAKTPKVDVHVRLDADVAGWFKASGKGYQARLNAALRNRL